MSHLAKKCFESDTVKLTAFHLFLHARQYPRVIEEQKATNNRRKIKEKIIYKNESTAVFETNHRLGRGRLLQSSETITSKAWSALIFN